MRDHYSSNKITRIITPVLFVTIVAVTLYVTGIAPHIWHTNASPFSLHNRKFIGTWYSHGDVLTIKQDGHAHFTGRVYRWCTEGPAPCDSIEGNTITPGIQREIVFNREQGNTLYGTVTSSTDHSNGQKVTARMGSNDTIDLNGEPLCGLNATPGYCGA